MDKETKKLIPPLTFRLYQSIRFNRPVVKEQDTVSPGGYEFVMKDEDGTEKTVEFDFEDYEGSIDKDNPCIVHCVQKNPDYAEFEDIQTLTEHMLRNIVEVTEWFIFTGEPGEQDNPLIPMEILDPEFEIINDATGKDALFIKIPVNAAISPTNSVEC